MTRVRTSLVLRISFLVLLFFPQYTLAQLTGPSEWQGVLHVDGAKLRIALHIRSAANGSLTGTIDSLDQDAAGIPVTSIQVQQSQVELVVSQVKGSFTGKLSKDGSEIKGTWQERRPLPLTFHRITDPSAVISPPRPIDGDWNGTLTTPEGELQLKLRMDATNRTRIEATLDYPGQSTYPVKNVTFDRDVLKFTMPALRQSFQGVLSQDGSEFVGNWTGRTEGTLVWVRTP